MPGAARKGFGGAAVGAYASGNLASGMDAVQEFWRAGWRAFREGNAGRRVFAMGAASLGGLGHQCARAEAVDR